MATVERPHPVARGRARPEALPALPAERERPLWQYVALVYALIALLVVLVIAAAFLSAYLVTGAPY